MTLEQALPLLVGPVAAGHSDMTLAQHTDYVSAALHNLVVSTRMRYTEPLAHAVVATRTPLLPSHTLYLWWWQRLRLLSAQGHVDERYPPFLNELVYPSVCSLCSTALPHMIVVCHGVSPRAASISLELLAKCSLRHSTVALQLGDKSISRSQVLKQVRAFMENQPILYKECLLTAHWPNSHTYLQIFRLYWELHPLLCLVVLSLPVLFCGLYVRTSLAPASHLSITHTV